MKSGIRVAAALLLVTSAACSSGSVQETLGLDRKAPDEFRVYSRPPLTVPPEFNLRPPGQGDENASGIPAADQAKSKVFGSNSVSGLPTSPTTGPADTAVPAVSANELPSNADAQFLSDAGAAKADPHVRQEIDQDKQNGVTAKNDQYLISPSKDGDSVVDSTKEAQRLKTDKDSNQPPTQGDTPVIQPKDKGILGDIF